MRPLLLFIFLYTAISPCFSQSTQQTPIQVSTLVYFSPGDSPTTAIVDTLKKAKKSVLVQAYSFTSAPIAGALRDAHRRGVKVQVILDKSQRTQKYTEGTFLKNVGIPVWIDAKHAIAHNKIIIVDESIVITGSFNFSKAAEQSNAENLLVIDSKDLARKYISNWQKHREHSEEYKVPSEAPSTRK